MHWIGLYLSFHLNWVLGPFVHGRLQNLQTSEVTFAHVITPLRLSYVCTAEYRYTEPPLPYSHLILRGSLWKVISSLLGLVMK